MSETHSNHHIFTPPKSFSDQAAIPSMQAYEDLCHQASSDYEGFWANQARRLITWKKPFEQVLDQSNAPFFKWFDDGTLNVSYNCLDRNLERGLGDKTALIFEADGGEVTTITYRELLGKTCQYAHVLKEMGVSKGDRVIIYISMSIDGVACMQACARIGAIHSVVFGGFSAQSLKDRIEDTGAKLVITADHQVRGGKHLPLKSIVDEAIAMGGCENIKHVLVVKRTEEAVNMVSGRDHWLADLAATKPKHIEPEWVNAEHPCFCSTHQAPLASPKACSTQAVVFYCTLPSPPSGPLISSPTIFFGVLLTLVGSLGTLTSPMVLWL